MAGRYATSTRASRLPGDWRSTIRPRILRRDPTCRLSYDVCTVVSTEVDHTNHGDDHSDTNLQGVCSPCHDVKSKAEAAAARRAVTNRRPAERHPGLT